MAGRRRCCARTTGAAWSSCRAAAPTRRSFASSTSRRSEFVDGGFELPEAKSDLGWIDEDRVYVGTDFGPGSLTLRISADRQAMAARHAADRGATVYEGKPRRHRRSARSHDPTEGFERDFVGRAIDFYCSEQYLRSGRRTYEQIDVPDDADSTLQREWLLVRLRTPWTVGGTELPGRLAGRPPTSTTSSPATASCTYCSRPTRTPRSGYYAWTRHHLLLDTLRDVRIELRVLTPDADGWRREPLAGGSEARHTSTSSTPSPSQRRVHAQLQRIHPTVDAALRPCRRRRVEMLKQAPGVLRRRGHGRRAVLRDVGGRHGIPYFVVRPSGRRTAARRC